jgi:hypothetical protein
MRDRSKVTSDMEQVHITLQTETSTQVTGSTMLWQVTVFTLGRMVIDTRDSSKITSDMEQVHTTMLTEISAQVTGPTMI